MSEREFDNYLTLLASLLRLDGRQRKQIAAELRAHLEDRLDELVNQGVPHDEAVQRALAEFGDAAALASSFGNISRGRKRRWLMRVTTFSIAATILIAAGIFTFWPGRNAAPGIAGALAQAKAKEEPAKPADPFAPRAEAAASQPEQARKSVDDELNKMTTIDAVEMPLKDLVDFLQDTHGFPILIKTKKLDEAGIPIDTPITKALKGVRLSTALEHILEDLDLTYVVQDELVLITTPEDGQSRLEIRVYDCRDLLATRVAAKNKPVPGEGGEAGYGAAAPAAEAYGGAPSMSGTMMPGIGGGMGSGYYSEHDHRAQRLMSIITTNVDDQTWHLGAAPTGEVGEQPPRGRGTISEYDGLIVVTQTAQTHRKIEHVLDMLRRASGLEAAKSNKVVR